MGSPARQRHEESQGGYAVVSTEDPNAMARDMAIFSAWFEMGVVPVLDITESTAAAIEAGEFRGSVT